jgi:hypothetical protein
MKFFGNWRTGNKELSKKLRTRTDVMILKIFSPKKSAKNWRF